MSAQMVVQEDRLAAAIIERVTGVTFAPPHVGLVIADEDGIIAGLVFNNYDRVNIDLSMATARPVGVKAVRDIARYVFGRLGCERVTCVTQADNVAAANRLRRLGFVREGRLRRRFPGGADGLIFGLLRSEQKLVRL